MDVDWLSVIQSAGIALALIFSAYALFKEHRFAKERIKLEKVFEQKISSYVELYGIIVNLGQILLQEKALSKLPSDKLIVETLTDFDNRLYSTLITKLYSYTLEGKHIFLSNEIVERVLELVNPAYYRAGVLGFNLTEEIKDENQLRQIVQEYREKVKPEVVSQKLDEIEKLILADLELDRISKEFKVSER